MGGLDEEAESEDSDGTAPAESKVEASEEDGAHASSARCKPQYLGRGPGGALAIGLVGHPNVGKTSVLNALAGCKAASVSGTAGHTKHLQHIRVDETVHNDAYVIDCPGLVFP